MPSVRESILAVNIGSSSLKYAVYPLRKGEVAEAGQIGALEGLEQGEAAFEAAWGELVGHLGSAGRLLAVAHRVVHGGARFHGAVRVEDGVLEALAAFNALAPLHQPHNLAGIRRFRALLPAVPQIACFDTAFHASLPESEIRFALPEALFQAGIRRYGFHGLSYRNALRALAPLSPRAQGRLVLAHLGSGASLCAVQAGQSRATTMGFSTLDGLVMGSRCGALDPGVLLHLLAQGWTPGQLEKLLYRESGLLGVSGLSADMRVLRASPDPAAQRAIALFTERVVRETGAMSAMLGGLEGLVFTGGIGEHDRHLRAEVVRRLAHLGLALDPALNEAADGARVQAIHAPGCRAEVWVVPADEGREAAREALGVLRSGSGFPVS